MEIRDRRGGQHGNDVILATSAARVISFPRAGSTWGDLSTHISASPSLSSSIARVPSLLPSATNNNNMSSAAIRAGLLADAQRIIPPLSEARHKGQAGRVGVVGGSKDYTGAPYFSSMSSMRLGADMTHTICEPDAGTVIKTYSPDLIVHRILEQTRSADSIRTELAAIFERLHSVVIGPGLGRDDHMQTCARIAVQLAREKGVWTVIDADGLWLIQNEPHLVKGFSQCVLTPNVVEFGRLLKATGISSDQENPLLALSKALAGPTIVEKGRVDQIMSSSGELAQCGDKGSLKRAGGQGDILSGTLGTFLAWARIYHGSEKVGKEAVPLSRLPLTAAFGACATTRYCSHAAFRRLGRAMLADDLLQEVGPAYVEYVCHYLFSCQSEYVF